jgi:hypothetical protein
MKQLIILTRDNASPGNAQDEFKQLWGLNPSQPFHVFKIVTDKRIVLLNGPLLNKDYEEEDGNYSDYILRQFPEIDYNIENSWITGIIFHSQIKKPEDFRFGTIPFSNSIKFVEHYSTTTREEFYKKMYKVLTAAIKAGGTLSEQQAAFDAVWNFFDNPGQNGNYIEASLHLLHFILSGNPIDNYPLPPALKQHTNSFLSLKNTLDGAFKNTAVHRKALIIFRDDLLRDC